MLNLDTLTRLDNLVSRYRDKYKNIDKEYIIKDIAIFTEYKKFCQTNPLSVQDAKNLEIVRRFDEGFLVDKGVTYFELFENINDYEYLRHSSILTCTSDLYKGRYLLPICTINGDVLSHMGYDKYNPRGKYEISRVEWIYQKRMVGNLESLKQYDGRDIYVGEGFFDAYRINETLKQKSIATLGSSKSFIDNVLFDTLKRKGHRLIYVPDHNEAGLNAINNFKWDDIYSYPSEYGDFDKMIFESREDEFKDKNFITTEKLSFEATDELIDM